MILIKQLQISLDLYQFQNPKLRGLQYETYCKALSALRMGHRKQGIEFQRIEFISHLYLNTHNSDSANQHVFFQSM